MNYDWYDGKRINEIKFCNGFLEQYPIKYIDKCFYGMDDIVPEQRIEKLIADLLIKAEVTAGISNRTINLINTLKRISYVEDFKIPPNEIHMLNGVLLTDCTFIQEKKFCKNRLNVNYNPNSKKPTI